MTALNRSRPVWLSSIKVCTAGERPELPVIAHSRLGEHVEATGDDHDALDLGDLPQLRMISAVSCCSARSCHEGRTGADHCTRRAGR